MLIRWQYLGKAMPSCKASRLEKLLAALIKISKGTANI